MERVADAGWTPGMKLDLDFVRTRRPYTLRGALLLLSGVVLATFGAQQYYIAEHEIAALEQELAMLARAQRGHGAGRQVNIDQLRGRLVLANQVMRKKSVPWDSLFRDIENASDKKIGLLGVQPDATTGFVRISGEARDAAALTDYILRLEKQPSLRNVHLTEHEIKSNQGQAVVRFNLNATWAGAQS
jgi:Tfp pilus assembly protein PilN